MFVKISTRSKKVLASTPSFKKTLKRSIYKYQLLAITGNQKLKKIHQHMIIYLIMISRRPPLLYQ